MLSKQKITFTAECIVSNFETGTEEKIATFGAILNTDANDLSFYVKQIDKKACKEYRDIVRADQAEFEDSAYYIQDKIMNPDT